MLEIVPVRVALADANGKITMCNSAVERLGERGEPNAVELNEIGFGSFIIDRALAMETDGAVNLIFGEDGLE